ncbi:MAG: hypothetical protein JXM70_11755 [Pirellulales bacterium]|nr:hypothetical protein [Pirellulales bacterium]
MNSSRNINRLEENHDVQDTRDTKPSTAELPVGNSHDFRKKAIEYHIIVMTIVYFAFMALVYLLAVFMPFPTTGLQKHQLFDRFFLAIESDNLSFYFFVMLPYLFVTYCGYLVGIRIERKLHSDILDQRDHSSKK